MLLAVGKFDAVGHPESVFGFRVVRNLGEGAASTVYEVTRPGDRHGYALKHVVRKDKKSTRFLDQLANEYALGKALSHPNVRRVMEFKTSRSLLLKVNEAALLMELMNASPLDMETHRRFGKDVPTLPYLLPILIQAARGMAYLNASGVVHCDMKPGNIMVTQDGLAKIIDLGHACKTGTVKKRIQGSPHFISPEQFRLEPVSYRTDVFNFGATCYWALTGLNIPTAYTSAKGIASGTSDNCPKPHTLRDDLPRELCDLVMECVRSKMADRPESMAVVANRLAKLT